MTGTLKALDHVLALSDDQTVIIPGHGPVSNKEGLAAYTHMRRTISGRIQKMIVGKSTLVQTLTAKPTKDFDEEYGNRVIRNTVFAEILYKDMTQD
jgi:cyclase